MVNQGVRVLLILLLVLFLDCEMSIVSGLSMGGAKTIYGVPNSGWTAPEWNWGYAVGTGHDCAAICRQTYRTRKSRAKLVDNLIFTTNEPQNFEEVKLVLALAWQRGRWDGSDGGRGGYGQVLELMAAAERYEIGNQDECSLKFIQDMQDRFQLLKPNPEDQSAMDNLFDNEDGTEDIDASRRRCSGLVLKAMGFIENGL